MTFIFDTENRKVKNLNNRKTYKLTKFESDLLLCLANEKINTYKEIGMFMYEYYDKDLIRNIRSIKTNLLIKTKYKLDIYNITNEGYVLRDEILIK